MRTLTSCWTRRTSCWRDDSRTGVVASVVTMFLAGQLVLDYTESQSRPARWDDVRARVGVTEREEPLERTGQPRYRRGTANRHGPWQKGRSSPVRRSL
jgi:hypothetical protein